MSKGLTSQHLTQKEVVVLHIYPVRTDTHGYFRRFKIFRDNGFKRLDVLFKAFVYMLCILSSYPQLFTDITRKIFACIFISRKRIIVLYKLRVSENIIAKLFDYLIGLHADELCHKCQIDLTLAVNGYLQGFLRSFAGNNFSFGQDSSLAENLRFLYRLFLGIDYFKCRNSVVVIIVLKYSLIGSVGNSTVGSLEFIIGIVKVGLQAFKLRIIAAPCLCVYHRHSFLTDKVHTHHSVKGLARFLNSGHYLVFSEKELAVNYGVSVVSHTRIGGNYLNIFLAFLGYGDSFDLALDFGYSHLQLFG